MGTGLVVLPVTGENKACGLFDGLAVTLAVTYTFVEFSGLSVLALRAQGMNLSANFCFLILRLSIIVGFC